MGGELLSQDQLDDIAISIEAKVSSFKNLVFIRDTSIEAAINFENSFFDFIYLDAIHLYENVKEDISVWLPKLKHGGVFAGDDCNHKFPGVEKAVKEIFGKDVIINKKLSQWHAIIN